MHKECGGHLDVGKSKRHRNLLTSGSIDPARQRSPSRDRLETACEDTCALLPTRLILDAGRYAEQQAPPGVCGRTLRPETKSSRIQWHCGLLPAKTFVLTGLLAAARALAFLIASTR